MTFPLAEDAVAAGNRAGAGAALLVAAATQEARRRISYANLSIIRDAMGPGQSLRRHLPPLLFLAATDPDDRGRGAALGSGNAAFQPADGHPGDRRVAEHARRRRPAESHGGGAGRRQGVRGGPAARHPHRRRVVRRHRLGRAAAHADTRGHHRRHRPVQAAAWHRGRQRHPGLAECAVPGCGIRPARQQSARRSAIPPAAPAQAEGGVDRAADQRTGRSRTPPSQWSNRAPTTRRSSSC